MYEKSIRFYIGIITIANMNIVAYGTSIYIIILVGIIIIRLIIKCLGRRHGKSLRWDKEGTDVLIFDKIVEIKIK
jgi:hypothetical protein